MRILNITMVVVFGILTVKSEAAEPIDRIPMYIYNAASAFDIDEVLLYSMCKVESNCRPRAINHDDGTSEQKSKGIVDKSYGLFQLKVSTAEGLGFIAKETVTVEKMRRHRLIKVKKVIDHTRDLLKPAVNAWYAAKLLRQLYDRYHNSEKVVSAYNAGHYTRANKDYVRKVFTKYAVFKLDKRLY